MISTRTRLFGLIGDPVSHSLSPIMQNHLFKLFGLDGVYLAFRTAGERLAEAISGARALALAGLNVTIPHKSAVVPLCDYRSPEVELLGVANTLVFRDGRIHAFTTDHSGFVDSLGGEKSRFSGSRVLLFGAGGSARAVAFALARLGIARLTIVNRSRTRGEELAEFCSRELAISAVEAISPLDPVLGGKITEAAILINATACGMFPHIEESPLSAFDLIDRRHFIYDLVYNPRETRFMRESGARGAAVQGGLDMLIFQGLAALNHWFYSDYRLDPAEMKKLKSLLNRELA
ncbi:MAG TPA: shikimate dehydrogenase [bacterium]|nr:shikimate dehydrogenase [bacterium]